MLRGFFRSLLVFSPMFISFGIVVMAGSNPLLFSLAAFIAGCSGVIIILRREIPAALGTTRGANAIVQGALITLICWGLSIVILVEGLKGSP